MEAAANDKRRTSSIRLLSLSKTQNSIELARAYPDVTDYSKGGPFHAARAIINDDGSATFQVCNEIRNSFTLIDCKYLVSYVKRMSKQNSHTDQNQVG